MKRTFIVLACLIAVSVSGQDAPTEKQLANRKIVKELNSKRPKLFEEKTDYLVLPGLLANKKDKKITVLGEATGIRIGDITEFFIIAEGSGHDYEAVAISFATAGDITKALAFIGMAPGHGVNFRSNQFWPKGERVKLHMGVQGSTDTMIPIEQYMVDDRTGKPLPEIGLAFTGSTTVTNQDGTVMLSADHHEPKSIASNYNEEETLFDIPYQGSQDALYDNMHPNPEHILPTNALLEIVIEPEYKDGTKRICDLSVTVSPPDNDGEGLTNHLFTVSEDAGKLLNDAKSLKSAIEVFSSRNRDNKDVYVSLTMSDELSLGAASQVCQLIQSLESSGSVRMEAPPAGQLYYKAFIPDPSYLDRDSRPGHPWELRLSRSDKDIVGKLTQCEFVWEDESPERPKIKATDYEVASPAMLRKTVVEDAEKRKAQDKMPNIPVVLVVTPADMTFGEMMGFVAPSMDVLPIVHVYALNE